MPHTELVKLANLEIEGSVTIDFSAQESLGFPLVVLQPHVTSQLSGVLTKREIEIASLVAKGLANKEIAASLGIQVGTVKDHLHRILEKAGCANRAALATAYSKLPVH